MPDLPAEARPWVAAADEYEQRRITADELTAVRVRAWQSHDACRATASPAELGALHVAMLRLWPGFAPDRWHESAWYFLGDCEAAGLSESRWWPLLQAQFPALLGGG